MTKSKTETLRKDQVLVLVPPTKSKLNKEDSIIFELRTDPANADSPKYKFAQRILKGTEEIHILLQWRKDGDKTITGLAVADGVAALHMWESMMTGIALTSFKGRLMTLATEARTEAAEVARQGEIAAGNPEPAQIAARDAILAEHLRDHFAHGQIRQALNHLIQQMVPPKTLLRAKRYMRRECRKPVDMTVRTYYQNLVRMNMEELPHLPPFGHRQSPGRDEMLDILLFGTPKSWQREMDRQEYDPMTKTPTEVVDFMERIEQSEETEGKKLNQASGNKAKGKTSQGGSKSKTGTGSSYCLLHGNCSHTTNDCHALKEQAKRLKTNSDTGKSKGKFSNKTWTKKADDTNKQSQKELNALVKKHLKKELNALTKKRKNDSEEEENLANELAAIDAQLKDFNYSDMDNLKIASDDDKSVGEVSC